MKKNIWIINHYAELPTNGVMTRHYNFARQLSKRGYNVSVFTSSAIHNSEYNSIVDDKKYKIENIEGFKFIHIKTDNYKGNKWGRIKNIFQFYFGVMKNYKKNILLEKPNVILASSLQPLSLLAGYKISKKLQAEYIVEIRDLWPESLFSTKPNSNRYIVAPFYAIEKWFYKKADKIIFTMEGGRDYIIDKGWEGTIDINKVYHINNGVDLEMFKYNKEHFKICDNELEDHNSFKVVYVGSIRASNNVSMLIEVAHKLIEAEIYDVKIFIYGTGDELEKLQEIVSSMNLNNIVFKGHVEKKYIPYILSKANLNLLHYVDSPIYRYGTSQNKNFDYLASGKPILNTIAIHYDLISTHNAGITLANQTVDNIVNAIVYFYQLSSEKYEEYCCNAKLLAQDYDFKKLTQKLVEAVEQ